LRQQQHKLAAAAKEQQHLQQWQRNLPVKRTHSSNTTYHTPRLATTATTYFWADNWSTSSRNVLTASPATISEKHSFESELCKINKKGHPPEPQRQKLQNQQQQQQQLQQQQIAPHWWR
jgi:hypothetical protein